MFVSKTEMYLENTILKIKHTKNSLIRLKYYFKPQRIYTETKMKVCIYVHFSH